MTERSLSVALLNPFFWPEVRRGSERVVHDLAVDLLSLGARPRLITSHPGTPRRSVEDGFPITRHWRPPEPWTMRRIEPHLSHVPFTYASLRAGHDDVAHAFYPTDALGGLRWSRRGGGPAIFSYMGHPIREVLSVNRLRKTILEKAICDVSAVTALSRSSGEALWRWFGVEPRVIYPGVDLELFRPGEGRAHVPTIACAGAVDDGRKRIQLLLRAFGRVRRERPEARLLLMRPRDPVLAQRFTEEHPGVELVDPTLDTPPLFREAWISGLTSKNEAFGLVLVESLACGTPVFGSREGGVPEIVDRPEVGRLFEGDDERDVATTILETLELSEDPATAQACRERAEVFDTMSGAQAYLDLYRELLAA